MSSPIESSTVNNEVVELTETVDMLGGQAVQEVIASQNKLAAALREGPVRRVLSPMVANPDLITM